MELRLQNQIFNIKTDSIKINQLWKNGKLRVKIGWILNRIRAAVFLCQSRGEQIHHQDRKEFADWELFASWHLQNFLISSDKKIKISIGIFLGCTYLIYWREAYQKTPTLSHWYQITEMQSCIKHQEDTAISRKLGTREKKYT